MTPCSLDPAVATVIRDGNECFSIVRPKPAAPSSIISNALLEYNFSIILPLTYVYTSSLPIKNEAIKPSGHYTWFVPKVSVLIFICTNWQRSTSLMYIGTLVVTLVACPYLFQLDWWSQSYATAVCVWSCLLTSLRLRCRKISNNGTLSNFV